MPKFKRRYVNIDETVNSALEKLSEYEECFKQDVLHYLLVPAVIKHIDTLAPIFRKKNKMLRRALDKELKLL